MKLQKLATIERGESLTFFISGWQTGVTLTAGIKPLLNQDTPDENTPTAKLFIVTEGNIQTKGGRGWYIKFSATDTLEIPIGDYGLYLKRASITGEVIIDWVGRIEVVYGV